MARSETRVCEANPWTLLDERGFRGSAKAGISVFDDDFGLHAQQVAPSACSTNAT